MKTRELRNLSVEELETKLDASKRSLFELNFKRKYGKVEKPHLFGEMKKGIAKILTVLKEKTDAK